jgi:hypothetical protein
MAAAKSVGGFMIRPSSGSFLAAFLAVFILTGAVATAQVVFVPIPDVTVSAGYSHLDMQRTNNLFYDHSGAYVDADFAWWLPTVVPLQAGIGFTGSGYAERESISFADTSNFYDPYNQHLYSDLGLFELEPRLGLHFGGDRGFFCVPRIGAGLLISSYDVDQLRTDGSNDETYIDTNRHTGAAFEIRPAIRAGYSWRFVSAGVEGSYMYSWGNFGAFGRHAQELRAGLFLKFTF